MSNVSPNELIEGYNWVQAFEASNSSIEPVVGSGTVSLKDFTIDNVVEVIATREGENDDHPWLAVVRLEDGRYVFLTAWCDYTGWDCQSGGQSWVSNDLEQLIQFGISDVDRMALGLSI